MRHLTASAILALSLMAGTAQGQVFDGWVGEASLAGSKTTGNTDTTDIGLALKLDKVGDVWTHKFTAAADFGDANGETNKQRYALGYQIDRHINDRTYVYGNADYFKDDFGAFQEGYFLGAGLGYKVLVDEPITWNLEAGLGYRNQTEQEPSALSVDELAGRLFSDFDWTLNDNVSAYNDTEVIFAESNTTIWNEIGLTAQIAGNLAARTSFRVDHNTNVAAGLVKTDTITRVGIVYTMD